MCRGHAVSGISRRHHCFASHTFTYIYRPHRCHPRINTYLFTHTYTDPSPGQVVEPKWFISYTIGY
ncbi:hypothetical protein B0F90DRAFT_1700805 [Multifurca ochricompacta]|uniref:Uncharacterized protein n=1 Tax=Multifurca ochricompacta TaxID=376703 RepID=A0AAD4M8F3_9AGAM|nr:hypothetical protein B0F90DRAFT_1700805 [Multifurca ochricompacta]